MKTYKNKAVKLLKENPSLYWDDVMVDLLLEYEGVNNFYTFFEEYLAKLNKKGANYMEELILSKLEEIEKEELILIKLKEMENIDKTYKTIEQASQVLKLND